MGKPKSVKAPAALAPIATPVVSGDAEDAEMRRLTRRSGFKKTFITGALAPSGAKRTELGAG